MSVDLLDYFQDAAILKHEGGHFVPASGPQKPHYIQFLEKMQKLCELWKNQLNLFF